MILPVSGHAQSVLPFIVGRSCSSAAVNNVL